MGAKKYYAVRKGKSLGIFGTWEECRASVEGCSGAEYKGFANLEEAQAYLGVSAQESSEDPAKAGKRQEPSEDPAKAEKRQELSEGPAKAEKRQELSGGPAKAGKRQEPSEDSAGREEGQEFSGCEEREREGELLETYEGPAKPEERPEPGTLLAYVDGSYDNGIKKYAFGCVFILPDGRVRTVYGNGDKEQGLKHRNVTGEMLGAMYAVRTAMASGYGKVELRYDYEGIEKWVTGQWRSKTELTGIYAKSMREWGQGIQIRFTKVTAHANVYYNELADKMAKTGLRKGQGTPKVRSLEEASTDEGKTELS